MPIGFRAFLNFERPSRELVESFREIPSSNIGDCVRKMYCMFDGIHPFNENGLLGTAFTVKVPSGDNLAAQAALDYAKPGDILVGDADGLVVIPRCDAPELLEAVRQNLSGEQREMDLMKSGLYDEQKHRENFTGLFLKKGGSL